MMVTTATNNKESNSHIASRSPTILAMTIIHTLIALILGCPILSKEAPKNLSTGRRSKGMESTLNSV